VKNNFGISERTAQGYMAVYRRFGVKEQYRNVQFSKLQEMLALPEITTDDMITPDDMSAVRSSAPFSRQKRRRRRRYEKDGQPEKRQKRRVTESGKPGAGALPKTY